MHLQRARCNGLRFVESSLRDQERRVRLQIPRRHPVRLVEKTIADGDGVAIRRIRTWDVADRLGTQSDAAVEVDDVAARRIAHLMPDRQGSIRPHVGFLEAQVVHQTGHFADRSEHHGLLRNRRARFGQLARLAQQSEAFLLVAHAGDGIAEHHEAFDGRIVMPSQHALAQGIEQFHDVGYLAGVAQDNRARHQDIPRLRIIGTERQRLDRFALVEQIERKLERADAARNLGERQQKVRA